MKQLIQFAKVGQGVFWFTLVFTIVLGASRSIIPALVSYIVDSVLSDGTSSLPTFLVDMMFSDNVYIHLRNVTFVILVFALFRGLLMILNSYLRAVFSEKVIEDIRNRTYHHVNHLSYTYHNNADTGDLIQRMTTDVDTIKLFLKEHVSSLIWIVSLAGSVIWQMFVIDPLLALLSIIVIPFTVGLSIYFFGIMKGVFETVEEKEAEMTTTVQENLNGVRVVKAFNREAFEIQKFHEKNEAYRLEGLKLYEYMAKYWSTSDAVSASQYAITLVIGTIFAINGRITLGEMIAFVMLVQIVVWPIRNLGRIIAEYSKTVVAVKRLHEILDVEDEYVNNGTVTSEIKGGITFKDVSFKFYDGKEPVLKNVSFEIAPGETIALMGKTGSGKSTIIKLLIRLLDITEGTITVDGVNIKDYDKKHLRKQIGTILQEPFLYSRTVEENIGITMSTIQAQTIEQAASTASLTDDIQKFEQGYHTVVGEKGVTLSGGQKQRVAIARILVNDRPIMIFDDSLSALDTETDLAIRSKLKERDKDTTIIIITHRITTAMEADRIMVLEDGEIVQNAPHETLIHEEGLYQSLYEIQTGLQEEAKGAM